MGTRKGVRQVSASSYELTFQFNGVRCREKIKLPPSKANHAYLVKLRGEILNAIERGTFDYAEFFPNLPRAKVLSKIPGKAMPLEGVLEGWLKRARGEVALSTYRTYEKAVRNNLIPAFGHMALADIRKSDVRNWASGLDCSRKRVSNLLTPLRQVLADAYDDDLIPKNPLYGWTYKKKDESGAQADPFTPEELARTFASTNQCWREHPLGGLSVGPQGRFNGATYLRQVDSRG